MFSLLARFDSVVRCKKYSAVTMPRKQQISLDATPCHPHWKVNTLCRRIFHCLALPANGPWHRTSLFPHHSPTLQNVRKTVPLALHLTPRTRHYGTTNPDIQLYSNKRDNLTSVSIGDNTLADAILDRLMHNAHKLELLLKGGDSMRKHYAQDID